MVGKVALVALQNTISAFDKLYSYILPADLLPTAQAGCRVTVPFGRGNIKRQGIIFKIAEGELKNLKSIYGLIDEEPILNEEMLAVCFFLHERTFCTYYDAVHAVLPTGLTHRMVNYYSANPDFVSSNLLEHDEKQIYTYLFNKGETAEKDIVKNFGVVSDVLEKMCRIEALVKNSDTKRRMKDATQKWVRLSDDIDLSKIKFTSQQSQVVSLLGEVGTAAAKEICYFTGVSAAVIERLISKGILIGFEKPVYRTPKIKPSQKGGGEILLTDEQQLAFNGLLKEFKDEKAHTALLYGITGSGKTQVFLKLVDAAVEQKRGVIVMVPEISLTPQLLGIFSARYGDKIAVFHSAMSMGQRMDEWKRIRDGKALIALGTRSAVFAPFKELGLVIIDEEQEHTYKSEQSPRFHARDVALFRIKRGNGLLCLASATPSIESYTKAKNGKISLYTLKNRYGDAVLPTVEVVDTRKEIMDGNTGVVSRRLYEALNETLDNGHQAILLLNRRGHNTYISCPSCGNVATCPNCSISLTYHSANHRLMCHYCGYSVPANDKCSECGCENIRFSGVGTQKAQQELESLFPSAKILRLDADSTISRDSYAEYLSDFAKGKYDLLLGTQMVAKGLDFPNVTLVGVLGADRAAFSEDFRSFERTFSLLTQVIGRAGRGDSNGTAIIQTAEPDSNLIALAEKQDYDGFYDEEILQRRLMIYPPYCDVCVVTAKSESKKEAESTIKTVFEEIKRLIAKDYPSVKLIILGPCAATVARVNNRYRYRMIIKCKNNSEFRSMLRSALGVKISPIATLTVDMNPESMI